MSLPTHRNNSGQRQLVGGGNTKLSLHTDTERKEAAVWCQKADIVISFGSRYQPQVQVGKVAVPPPLGEGEKGPIFITILFVSGPNGRPLSHSNIAFGRRERKREKDFKIISTTERDDRERKKAECHSYLMTTSLFDISVGNCYFSTRISAKTRHIITLNLSLSPTNLLPLLRRWILQQVSNGTAGW